MKKEEFAVGETFQLGLKKLKVMKQSRENRLSCIDCALYGIHCELLFDITGNCDSSERTDGKDIVFVEVEEEE